MEQLKKLLPTRSVQRTATASTAGAACGYLLIVCLDLLTDLPITPEQGAGVSTALGTIFGFGWNYLNEKKAA